jgi:hypothetical protein
VVDRPTRVRVEARQCSAHPVRPVAEPDQDKNRSQSTTTVAVPPSNDVDVFAHDLGYIAILDKKGNPAVWRVWA